MNSLLCSAIKVLEPGIIKDDLNVLGQDKCFGLFLVLCIIIILGSLESHLKSLWSELPIFQKLPWQVLNFARWNSLDTVVLDAYSFSALTVIHSNTCLSYLPLSGENTEYIQIIHITHCFLSSPVTSWCLSCLLLLICVGLFYACKMEPVLYLAFFSLLLHIYTILSSLYYATFFLHLVLCL